MTAPLPGAAYLPSLASDAARFAATARRTGLSPFGAGDTTAGMEYELQVAVEGSSDQVDLPLTISHSGYFKNIVERSRRGDCSEQIVDDLQAFLADRHQTIWENSWIRMKTGCLSNYAARMIETDFLADKSRPNGPLRSDRHLFFVVHRGEQWLRLPISYVLKLALADCIGRSPGLPERLRTRAEGLLDHFISDNTSPEVLSLSIVKSSASTIGCEAARETARTYLVCQLLINYANTQFGLKQTGQRAVLYFAPQAPVRQKRINDLIPDSFYRQLYMSPCLSGWNRGEDKHAYMELCHRTLSRSQLNTLVKLREAGILVNNLVVLPNTSNTCLANNGTHVSLGSTVLSSLAAEPSSGFTPAVETYFGDLVIKIFEHFLPLLVTTCSAAPYRIDYADFHPEKVLGFLPHELDYTHLRMLWRRWQKKADISVFSRPLTPFGPPALDRLIALICRTRGDLVPDFRLIDYLVALLSTDTSPALSGIPGVQDRLKRDLAEMGVFDERMTLYLPCRVRDYQSRGFCGFEGRFYSLFPRLRDDLGSAVDIQNLITALAYRLVLQGSIDHNDIPDTPTCESERRQIFFAAAIGIPTVFIRTATNNRLLARILTRVEGKRNSRRYRGYTRITVRQYQLAVLAIIEEECPDLIENLHAAPCLAALRQQLLDPNESAAGRLTGNILTAAGYRQRPLSVPAERFNLASEAYYRNALRLDHLKEGLAVLAEDCRCLEQEFGELRQTDDALPELDDSPTGYLRRHEQGLLDETLTPKTLRTLLTICLIVYGHRERR